MSVKTFELRKRFGSVRALTDVNLDVPTGSLTALLGPSGCGKTTLLRAIAGFETPDSGRIVLGDVDVTNVRLGSRDVGFVFQNYALFPHLDVARNVAFGLDVRGTARARGAARVAELLELVRLPGYGRRMPHELSGGQRQRVALARALAANPKFLLLDEPFAALDATVRRELRRWLRSLHEETHVTTLLVTHDADEAMEIADRIVLLADGGVVQSGTPQNLYAEPCTPFAMRFLGETSCFEKDGLTMYVRPHDIRVEPIVEPAHDDVVHAQAERLVDYGARMHVELRLDHGSSVVAEVRPGEHGAHLIQIGARYALRFLRTRTFTTEAAMEISA